MEYSKTNKADFFVIKLLSSIAIVLVLLCFINLIVEYTPHPNNTFMYDFFFTKFMDKNLPKLGTFGLAYIFGIICFAISVSFVYRLINKKFSN